jgi:hypothetical protein
MADEDILRQAEAELLKIDQATIAAFPEFLDRYIESDFEGRRLLIETILTGDQLEHYKARWKSIEELRRNL